ncbi:hypothetical protein [Yoonia maricola]|uniref:hypothetical protein n=1 Tax=Yoonia maricola TaxID=420999 RepID=UPI000C234456|nr:hypothetical protein [Yoonia maricola]
MAAPTEASVQAAAETPQAEQISASTQSLEVTVDDSFAATGLQWNSNGAEIFIRYRPVMENGEMYICGAYSNRGGSIFSRLGRQAVNGSTVKMNGDTIMRGVGFFNVVSNANREAELVGTTAFCRNTGLSPSREEFATVQIDVPTGRYRIQR